MTLGSTSDWTNKIVLLWSKLFVRKSFRLYDSIFSPNYAIEECNPFILFPEEVDGQWSSWSQWTTCSATCGGGSRVKHRECNSPAPSEQGKRCPGSKMEREDCNTSTCKRKFTS